MLLGNESMQSLWKVKHQSPPLVNKTHPTLPGNSFTYPAQTIYRQPKLVVEIVIKLSILHVQQQKSSKVEFYSIINANTFVLTQYYSVQSLDKEMQYLDKQFIVQCTKPWILQLLHTCVHMNNGVAISVGSLSFSVAVNGLTWTVSGTDWNSGILNYLFSGFWFMLNVYSINLLVVIYRYVVYVCLCVCGVCACLCICRIID